MIRSYALFALLLCAPDVFAVGDNSGKVADARASGPLVEYYDVYGSTAREIWKDLEQKGPINRYGERAEGMTTWDVSYRYTLDGDERHCRVETLTAELRAGMKLPRWTPPEKASPRLVSGWQEYSAALRRHEDQHYDLAVEAATELERRLAERTGTRGCEALARQLDKAADTVLGEYDIKQAQFDLETDHGAKQGVLFPR